jgi:KDEL-tailed cysteine endopeptidase
MDNAFQFIKKNGGITTESRYPYQGEQHSCDQSKVKKGSSMLYPVQNSNLKLANI